MNLYRFEMKSLRGNLLGWSVAICCFVGIYMGMFPLFQEEGSAVAAMFDRFPDTLRSLYGMEHLDFSDMRGYLAFPMKLLQELLAVGGLILGIRITCIDTRQKCADFLYAKPLSHRYILAVKAAALISAGAVYFLVTAAAAGITSGLVAPGQLPLRNLLVSSLVTVMMFWLYGAAGLLIGTRFPQVKGGAAIGVCALFVFHIIFSVAKVVTGSPNSVPVRLLVPICLLDRDLAAQQGVIEWPFLLLWIAEAAVLLLFAFRARRRDVVNG